ncbi:MAG TPA: hypothetical protein VFJ93_00785 [Gaiellaceae bacterium]|nr:hypothetical protein [Gaiellaceae bacterium]
MSAAQENPVPALIRTRSGWLIDAPGGRIEVEHGAAGGWRVTSSNGRERIDSSFVRAAAAACRVDKASGWLLTLERQLSTHHRPDAASSGNAERQMRT